MSDERRCLCGCGTDLPAGTNRGEPRKFLNHEHQRAFHRQAAQVGAAVLVKKQRQPKKRRRGMRVWDRQISAEVFSRLVAVEERAELLRQAAENLGITDEGEIRDAIRRAGVMARQEELASA